MDRVELAELCDARDKLCGFCEADECEKCIVTRLIDDACAECDDYDDDDYDDDDYDDDDYDDGDIYD